MCLIPKRDCSRYRVHGGKDAIIEVWLQEAEVGEGCWSFISFVLINFLNILEHQFSTNRARLGLTEHLVQNPDFTKEKLRPREISDSASIRDLGLLILIPPNDLLSHVLWIKS